MKLPHDTYVNSAFSNISRRNALKMISLGLSFSMFAPLLSPALSHAADANETKPLVVYFSMPETDNVAMLIQEMTGGDIFRIIPQVPYPTDHRTLVDLAKEEQNTNARPAISGTVNVAGYDVIFLGYPNWWGDMPMILYTFLEQYDLSGKTIIPFCTHGGSGLSNTVQAIQNCQPDATVIRNSYVLSRNRMERAPSGVAEWLKEIGLKK